MAAHPSGGFSAAVVVGEDRYIIDFGRGWLDRYFKAGLERRRRSPALAVLKASKRLLLIATEN